MHDACLSAFRGRWYNHTAASAEPPYELTERSAAEDHFWLSPRERQRYGQCRAGGDRSWQWRWASAVDGCDVAVPTPPQLCAALSGQRLLLVGDSLMKQHLRALVHGSTAARGSAAARESLPASCPVPAQGGWCFRLTCHASSRPATVCGATHEFTLINGSDGSASGPAAAPAHRPHGCETAALVLPASATVLTPACLGEFDAVVMGEFAHWVGVGGAGSVAACLRGKGVEERAATAESTRWVLQLYAAQMRRRAALLATSAARPKLYYLTAPLAEPGRHTDGLLPPAQPKSPRFAQPAVDLRFVETFRNTPTPYGHQLYASFNAIARDAFRNSSVRLVDLELPLSFRVDGHGADALHFCLPGVPDFLSAVLYSFVLRRGGGRDRA